MSEELGSSSSKAWTYFRQAVTIRAPKRSAVTSKCFFPCLPYAVGYSALIGVAFFFLYSAFSAAQNLLGTVGGSMGSWSLAVLYVSNAVSNPFAPILVRLLKEKWCLVIGASLYIFYLAANINPIPTLLMVSAFFSGIGAGLLWNAQSSFLVHVSSSGEIAKNSGVFFLFYQSSSVVGNVISASTIMVSITTSILFIILTAIATLGLVTMLFIVTPPLSADEEQEKDARHSKGSEKDAETQSRDSNRKKLAENIFISFVLMKQKRFLLLMPFFVANGLMQAFYFSTFTSIVGKEWIGWVMATFGASDAVGSLLFGKFMAKIGIKVTATIATVAIVGPIVVLNAVPLNELRGWMASFFLMAAFLGISDSAYTLVLFVGINSYFPSKIEPAFGAFRFYQAMSSAGIFFLTPYVSFYVGSYIAAGGSGIALISILVADLKYQSLDQSREMNAV